MNRLGALAATVAIVAGEMAAADPMSLIARLNYAGFRQRNNCTAALVGAGHVVAAAHCVPERDVELVFLFGYDFDAFDRILTVHSPDMIRDPDRDVAIWCFADPLETGLAMAESVPDIGDPLQIVGYGIPLQHRRQVTDCPLLARSDSSLTLGCQVTQGTSGAPALAGAGAFLHYLGVTTASGPGQTIVLPITAADIGRLCGPG